MRLRKNEFCPIHRSLFCCGREETRKERRVKLGIQRIDDPHHPRGYRELRSPAEMRKLLNRKIAEQGVRTSVSPSGSPRLWTSRGLGCDPDRPGHS